MTETSERHRHRQNNTETRQRQDQERTETQPRQDRDITETKKHHRSTYGLQLHWFAQRCTIYKFKLEFEVLLKNPVKMLISVHHQKIKTQSPKQKKQHCNINDKTPSHHPLIIINITAPSPHITETSPNMPETSPTHHWKVPKTPSKNQQNNTKTTPRHHQKKTETETWPRHQRDIAIAKITPRQDRDKTKKGLRRNRDKTETSRRQRSIIGRHTGYSYTTLVCPKVHNIQIQIGIWSFA